MKMSVRTVFCSVVILAGLVRVKAADSLPEGIQAVLALKIPGNAAVEYPLSLNKLSDTAYEWRTSAAMPVRVLQTVSAEGDKQHISVCLTADRDVYFNFREWIPTGFLHNDCLFYLPGFWYHRNLRSPKEAPSFHTSDSWVIREDRLSAPLTGIFDERNGAYMTVARLATFDKETLTTHKEGEVILSGSTSVGFTGFENRDGYAALSFGFPYREAPKSYMRKLTLAPPVTAFQLLKQGESITLTWQLNRGREKDYSEFIGRMWEYAYDTYRPQPVQPVYSPEKMKEVFSNFFIESLVTDRPLTFNSGTHVRVADCKNVGVAEVGFVGRVLLNAFNAWEYGWQTNRNELKENASRVFGSYLKNGFTPAGFLKEFVDYRTGQEATVHSIRRQSEGIYAMLHFLDFEKRHGRRHYEWEQQIRQMLNTFLRLQNPDGSFPRKFRDDFSIVDNSGGSTPSATLPLIMGYKYFKDKRYLASAKRTAGYLEKELISKSDYFSSTLDANCEDKEASIYTATAMYYLALVTWGEEQRHCMELAKKAAYFALSWYYVWDVPFAPGQMLGDIGLKTRGWGNVSVENNHIDVFVFEFTSVLNWLSAAYDETRFADFAKVVNTSMRQLLPYEGHLCGVAKRGYYPEVVQHTNWDYGKNGKGYYNDIFAPGWVVPSLWELLTPGRAERFLTE